jgi:AraC-like DNA-binding protein
VHGVIAHVSSSRLERSNKLTCSPLLVRPFARLLRSENTRIPRELVARFEAIEAHPDRVHVTFLRESIAALVTATGDPTIGLRAATYTEVGDFEAFEWVSMSAETWRAGMEIARRYVRILNDASDFHLEVFGDRAHLMLGSTVPLHSATVDYQVAAFHLAIQLRVNQVWPEMEVWFRRRVPEDLTPYRSLFAGLKLVFSAPFDGFSFDAWRLDTAMPTANPSLHRVLRAHAEHLLDGLSTTDPLVGRVTADIFATMPRKDATAERTAERFSMTRRTLTRKLSASGTSFSLLLREARHRAAIHYLLNSECSVEDVALLLGFSECAPFVRAFQRWTGYSPQKYRNLQRGW